MLKGKAKANYQREYMRQYMRDRRNVKTSLRPAVKTSLRPAVKTQTLDKLRQTIKSIENKDKAPQRPSESLPLYNPAVHGPGDRVMMKPLYGKRLVETVIPLLDADGNPMPE